MAAWAGNNPLPVDNIIAAAKTQ